MNYNFIFLEKSTFRKSFKSLSLATLRNSARPNSWSNIAEFSNACSCSGSNSKALSKYAKACDAFPCSKNTTPSCKISILYIYLYNLIF